MAQTDGQADGWGLHLMWPPFALSITFQYWVNERYATDRQMSQNGATG